MEPLSRDKLMAETPPSVKKANMVIVLYGLLLVINSIVYGIRFGLWLGFVQSFGFLLVAVWIGGSLLTKRPSAWWIAVVAGSLLFIRCFIGLPAWFMMRSEGRVLDIQRPIYYAAGLVFSAAAVVLLMKRDSRAYYKRIEEFA